MQRKLMFLVKSCKFKVMKNILNKKIVLILIYLWVSSSLWVLADDGVRSKDFYSPYFIAGTSSVTQLLSPQSEAVNPASGALTQRVTLDLSYIGIIGEDGDISGYNGHGINIGNTIPTKAGVLSWSGHFLTSQYPSVYADPTFSFNGSFSKELYPDLLVGAGVKFAGSFEPGVSAMVDLGVISSVGKLGPFKDFRWGFVLQDFGYSGISTAYPDPFSLSGGVSTNISNTDFFKINAYADLGLIGLSNFKTVILTLGSEITFKDTITLNIGSRIDSFDLIHNNPYGIIPSIGIHYSYKTDITQESTFMGITEKGWNKSEINIHTGFSMISQNLWATGVGVNIPLGSIDKQAPVIKLDISGFETDEKTEDTDKQDNTVSFFTNKNNFDKLKYSKTKSNVKIELQKATGKDYNIIKKIENENMKYKGRYDKRYPDSGISFYISPNNDGIKDDLTFPINISDTRYLKGYAFIIKDADGNIIREIRNKEKRVENQGFTGFFDRLFSIESGIDIPEEFRWDGLDNNGSTVSDGIYYFSVEAWDDNGNKGQSDSYAIVIDSKLPDLELSEPEDDMKIFSPNGDNNKDTFKISQTGSVEDLWEAEILDSTGNTVKTFKFINDIPRNFEWDGTDNNGNMTSDGVFSYKISSVDRAGNSLSKEISNIIKNTEETPITINIDKSFFSPNNDMILDTLIFTPEIPVSNGILNWKIIILDTNGNNQRTIEGDGLLPESIVFNGRDKDGIILEEGAYTSKIDVLYLNGNHPNSVSPVFTIDVSPPVANVKSDSVIFSPNGDNLKDEITFYQESSTEIIWTGLIKSEDGKIIDEYQWFSAAEPIFNWNGTLPTGRLSPDGNYTYQLLSIDRAGNAGQSEIIEFTLNTEETPLILTTNLKYFSPNGDSIQDNISLIPKLKVLEGISSYSLDILDSNSNIVRNFSGTTKLPEEFLWNGIRSNGRVADDGNYVGKISIIYKKGNAPTSISQEFIIDTIYPDILISSKYILFSPDSDGKKDFIEIEQKSSLENLWQAEVINNNGDIVTSYYWKGSVNNLKWDGKDENGNIVPDGKYSYSVSSSDNAGNTSLAKIEDIIIDTKPTALFITVNDKYLSPTGNGMFEDLKFTTIVNNKSGLESWSLKMVNQNGNIEKEFSGDSNIPKSITWNGLNTVGKIIEGDYTAVFSAIYTKGNEPKVHSSKFSIDVSPPTGIIELSPIPFSPDNDGVDDEIVIKMKVNDASGIKKWSFEIEDPEKRSFKTFSGEGAPADKILWDGLSSQGELVYAAMDYPVKLVLEDNAGNKGVFTDKIPVDVLVVREGDILKIKIANIIFKVNSPDLLADSPEVIEQNKFILNRVSELLKKYSTYRITIEGHAVLTKWNDPVAAKREEIDELGPLSEKRAITVLNYLTRLGIPASRMDSEGMGGKEPLVPHSDLENRWKNRRVEFILWKD